MYCVFSNEDASVYYLVNLFSFQVSIARLEQWITQTSPVLPDSSVHLEPSMAASTPALRVSIATSLREQLSQTACPVQVNL